MLRIDAKSSREIQALILSIRQANKEVNKEIRKHTKVMIAPEWKKALAEQATTRVEHRVLVDTARVAVSNQNVKLKAGGMAKKLSGGARTREITGAAEFGSSLKEIQYTGKRKGKTFPVTRTTGKQFRHEQPKGWVVYPAAAQIIPRLASLWIQTAVRTLHEAFERK